LSPAPVAILCGGRGTRLREQTESMPKALVEIGGRPILWHVIRIYASQGFREFVLLTGYLGEQIEAFVAAAELGDGVEVRCVATGEDTPTGGRVKRAAAALGGASFHLTYADGVADIDLAALGRAHTESGRLATVTVVRPELQFGIARLAGDGAVSGFEEKPRSEHWVNGGFFCLEPGALDYLSDESVLEREPLAGLASDGQLTAYRHEGFWDCMDTYKDAVLLNDLWREERAPWKAWVE